MTIGLFRNDEMDHQLPVGIAKDGYIMWNYFKDNGDLWSDCEVDVCNGVLVDGTNYGYVSTSFHPYYLGCFGPGDNTTFS
mmetsp:Transcript_12749/g.12620  ORF Transcript_12749/g.12620 Transcript_12749/m.12620 type:complete len:80 (-) Transcript_12749:140-379(-)